MSGNALRAPSRWLRKPVWHPPRELGYYMPARRTKQASESTRKGRRNSRRPSSQIEYDSRLLRGDFARRIERAGIMDLRHLMIAEAENLPQDFVGMFAEQRGAGHLGRAV